jgi:lactate dehydrogenase-like 2-hydroxyacid dehydrogenase
MGIVGGGNIGFLVAKMFHAAFDGPIILYDPFIDDEALRKWQGAIRGDGAFRLVDALDRLLEQADIISLHVPLTKSTENLIADREIRLMKRSAILVNTARGGIIHEGDLAIALAENRIFGAGLDAFVNEPPSLEAYPELCREDRVIMTWVARSIIVIRQLGISGADERTVDLCRPHIGAATEAAQQDTCRSMVEHLVEAFEAKTLRDRVC